VHSSAPALLNGLFEQPARENAETDPQLCSQLDRILNVAKEATPPVLSSPAASLDGLFEHPHKTSLPHTNGAIQKTECS